MTGREAQEAAIGRVPPPRHEGRSRAAEVAGALLLARPAREHRASAT